MSNHDKALLTYEALRKRKAEKIKKKERELNSYFNDATNRCAKLCCKLHSGKGVHMGKAPSSY